MAELIHYGLICCGMMGQEHIRNIQLLPDTRITAIFEPDAGMRAKPAALVPDVKCYDSIAALLAVPQLGSLVITSPNHLH